jgi:hypothetical protein
MCDWVFGQSEYGQAFGHNMAMQQAVAEQNYAMIGHDPYNSGLAAQQYRPRRKVAALLVTEWQKGWYEPHSDWAKIP